MRALTGLNLVAGLASTVSAPLIAAHMFGLRGPRPVHVEVPDAANPARHRPGSHRACRSGVDDDPSRIALSRPFVLLVIAGYLGAFCSFVPVMV